MILSDLIEEMFPHEEPRAGACWVELVLPDNRIGKHRCIEVPGIDTGETVIVYLGGKMFKFNRNCRRYYQNIVKEYAIVESYDL